MDFKTPLILILTRTSVFVSYTTIRDVSVSDVVEETSILDYVSLDTKIEGESKVMVKSLSFHCTETICQGN